MTGLKNLQRMSLAMILAACWLAMVPRAAFADEGGEVLPPKAKPHGYSLTDMASAIALFTTSGNNSAYYPATPFQILSEDTSTVVVTPTGGGIVVTGGNSFTVASGTPFFVPVFYVDDSPTIIGTFPTAACDAAAYVFDKAQERRPRPRDHRGWRAQLARSGLRGGSGAHRTAPGRGRYALHLRGRIPHADERG